MTKEDDLRPTVIVAYVLKIDVGGKELYSDHYQIFIDQGDANSPMDDANELIHILRENDEVYSWVIAEVTDSSEFYPTRKEPR